MKSKSSAVASGSSVELTQHPTKSGKSLEDSVIKTRAFELCIWKLYQQGKS